MNKQSRVLILGATGLVGSAIGRRLRAEGFSQVMCPSSKTLNLVRQAETAAFFQEHRPEFVFLAAARVGGILANSRYPADFIYDNLMIELNTIHSAHAAGVKKMLIFGSSCIYPKDSEIPIRETSLLTGAFEKTNEAYAIAKTVGVKMADYYRKEFGDDFISVMPTNTFGPNDNFDLDKGHMVPALIHRFHLAKVNGLPSVTCWGSGRPRRELMHVDDVADAALFMMQNYSDFGPINVGSGVDYSIQEIASMIKNTVKYEGELIWDTSKPDGVFRKVMDISRAKKMGWTTRVSLEAGLQSAYQWFLGHAQGLEHGARV
jgi:GDP-L-fucose synthase